jgi:competence protein ComFC
MNRLKFDKIRSLSSYFSLGLGQILPELKRLDLDGIIPVPSHKNSEKERPFLPTEILVRRLEKKLGIPILPLVQKCSKTRQSSLNRESRIFHAQKAFQFVPNSGFSPCGNYLLVDDVFTTGASVNEIARILLEAGAGKVFVLVSTRPEEGLNI